MTRTSILASLVLALEACSVSTSSDSGSFSAGEPSSPGSSGSGGEPKKGTSGASGGSSEGAPSGNGQPAPQGAGVLTAGVWDDNRNFDIFSSFVASQHMIPGALPFAAEEFAAAHTRAQQANGAKQKLDVALMVDTTGSMGDEISYLQKEFDALSSNIAAKYPGAEQRWSLVLYRDLQDAYVTKTTAFSSDLSAFRSALNQARPDGGGDYPEASERALEDVTQLTWRAEADVAKMLFWITDAPHHTPVKDSVATSIRSLQNANVHVYPVAASGVDDLAELTLRESAQLTGGRYVFLTDDSGVGNPHAEPRIPCYFVTKLNNAVLRMIDVEMTGAYREPTAEEVIRTAGDPKSGKCALQNNTSAEVF
jgi:hypothetical protein